MPTIRDERETPLHHCPLPMRRRVLPARPMARTRAFSDAKCGRASPTGAPCAAPTVEDRRQVDVVRDGRAKHPTAWVELN